MLRVWLLGAAVGFGGRRWAAIRSRTRSVGQWSQVRRRLPRLARSLDAFAARGGRGWASGVAQRSITHAAVGRRGELLGGRCECGFLWSCRSRLVDVEWRLARQFGSTDEAIRHDDANGTRATREVARAQEETVGHGGDVRVFEWKHASTVGFDGGKCAHGSASSEAR
jgi:hypothetical protein